MMGCSGVYTSESRCVAVQTVNELYKVSSDEEALTLLADVAAYARSSETPPYPSR